MICLFKSEWIRSR